MSGFGRVGGAGYGTGATGFGAYVAFPSDDQAAAAAAAALPANRGPRSLLRTQSEKDLLAKGGAGYGTGATGFGAYVAFPSDDQAAAAAAAAALPANRGSRSLLRTQSEKDLLAKALEEPGPKKAKGLLADYGAKLMRDGRSSLQAAEAATQDTSGRVTVTANVIAERFYGRLK